MAAAAVWHALPAGQGFSAYERAGQYDPGLHASAALAFGQ